MLNNLNNFTSFKMHAVKWFIGSEQIVPLIIQSNLFVKNKLSHP